MVGAALFETRRLSQRCSGSGRCGPRFSGGAFLSEADASGGGAAEISFKNPTHATSICAGSHLTIAPRVVPARHSWQHFEASTAVRIGSACSVRTGVRHGPVSLPNHMGQPIFATRATRARTALAHNTPDAMNLPPDRRRF